MKEARHFLLCIAIFCSAGAASAQDPCINPFPQNAFETYFVQSAHTLFSVAQPMSTSVGDVSDFCFTAGRGNTYFYRAPPLRRSGIRLSVDDLNAAYAISLRGEDAFLVNFVVLLHELGHMTAYYMARQNSLVSLATQPGVQMPFMVSWRLKRTPEDLMRIQQQISQQSMASEAFADCVAGFMLQSALQGMLGQLTSSPDPNAHALAQYLSNTVLPASMQAVMQNVARVAAPVNLRDRVHGTVRERTSFMVYGMQAARHYGGWSMNNASRAATELALCSVSAYEMQLRHIPGRETPFIPFNGALGY